MSRGGPANDSSQVHIRLITISRAAAVIHAPDSNFQCSLAMRGCLVRKHLVMSVESTMLYKTVHALSGVMSTQVMQSVVGPLHLHGHLCDKTTLTSGNFKQQDLDNLDFLVGHYGTCGGVVLLQCGSLGARFAYNLLVVDSK